LSSTNYFYVCTNVCVFSWYVDDIDMCVVLAVLGVVLDLVVAFINFNYKYKFYFKSIGLTTVIKNCN